jgi:hypothetical protein
MNLKNSLVPVVGVLLTTVVAVMLASGGASQGEGGPSVNPGIFAFPKKSWQRQQPAAVVDTPVVEGMQGGGQAWRIVQINGADADPFTRTVALGFAEELTQRGLVAVLNPAPMKTGEVRPEPLPLPPDVVLTVRGSASRPAMSGQAVDLQVTVVVETPRPGSDHPAARLLPTLGVAPGGAVSVRLQTTPMVADWPAWYAGLGHAVAGAVSERLAVPASLPTEVAAAAIQAVAWDDALLGLPPRSPASAGRLPSPPQGDVVVDLVPFQQPLVRGWIGRLSPVPLAGRDGEDRQPIDGLRKRLKKGEWSEQPAPAGTLALWSRDDRGLTRLISLRPQGDRVEFVEWQERPDAGAIYQHWAQVAAGSSTAAALAATLVETHRQTPGIPESFRQSPVRP